MSVVTWQNLPKSISDSQTIATYIASQLATHNADDSAHGQSDEAIYNHRIAEILDHLDASVLAQHVADANITEPKIAVDRQSWHASFDSLDGMTITNAGGGSVTCYAGVMAINGLDDDANDIRIKAGNLWIQAGFHYKSPVFQTLARIYQGEVYTVYFGLGQYDGKFAGFKIVSGTIYACCNTGASETTHSLGSLPDGNYHAYKVDCRADDAFDFYIDGELVYTKTTGNPTTTATSKFYDINAHYTSGNMLYVGFMRMIIYQDF